MTGTWPLGWATGDVEVAAQYGKGIGSIFDTTLGGSAANVDITSIVGTYAHLLLAVYGRSDQAAATIESSLLRLNGDATANYDYQILHGNASSALAIEGFTVSSINIGNVPAASAGANLFGCQLVFLPHYAGSTNNKVVNVLSSSKVGTTTSLMDTSVSAGFWRSSAAITRITLLPASGNFIAGTRVTLYALGA